MFQAKKAGVVLTALLASGGVAQQENHITVDTDGSRIVLDTGYLPEESEFSIGDGGWVLYRGERLVRESFAAWEGSPLTGWQLGAESVLTSDHYAPTGRLDGGDFLFEIASFERVGGGRGDFAWAQRDGFTLERHALLSGSSREERSFRVGFSGHPHGQVWLAESPGLYRLSLVAWDANAVYADSDPVHLYIRSVPAPGAIALLPLAGLAASRRRR